MRVPIYPNDLIRNRGFKICVSWACKADVDASLVTPHSVRKTTDGYADLIRQMSERMGHHSANTSLAYAVGLPTTSSTVH